MNTNRMPTGYFLGASAVAASGQSRSVGAYRVMVAGAWTCVVVLIFSALFRHAIPLNAASSERPDLGGGFAFVSGGASVAGVAQRNPDAASRPLSRRTWQAHLLLGVAVPFTLRTVRRGIVGRGLLRSRPFPAVWPSAGIWRGESAATPRLRRRVRVMRTCAGYCVCICSSARAISPT